MSQYHNGRKWYQQKRWIIGSLLLFPPLGIPLLWLTRWPRAGKIGGSILSGIILLLVVTGKSSEPTVASNEPPALAAAEAPTPEVILTTPAYDNAITEATAATAETAAAESSADWTSVANRWQSAIASLGDIPISSGDYSQAQVKIAEYERNYDYAIAQRDAIESALVAQQQAEAQAAAQPEVAVAEEAQTELSVVETQGGYVGGTCKELKASGVGSNFTPGDANYTSARDRDNDGVACES